MTLKPKSSGLVRPICVYHVKGAVITGCCRQLGLEYKVDEGKSSGLPEPRRLQASCFNAALWRQWEFAPCICCGTAAGQGGSAPERGMLLEIPHGDAAGQPRGRAARPGRAPASAGAGGLGWSLAIVTRWSQLTVLHRAPCSCKMQCEAEVLSTPGESRARFLAAYRRLRFCG